MEGWMVLWRDGFYSNQVALEYSGCWPFSPLPTSDSMCARTPDRLKASAGAEQVELGGVEGFLFFSFLFSSFIFLL